MKEEHDISYIRRLISYFKSKEVTPSKEEEDRVWNNIMSEIKSSQRKRVSIKGWQLSVASLSAAAMLAGAFFFLQDKDDEADVLYAVYQSMAEVSSEVKQIQILADDKEMTDVDNNTTIDYSKSENEITVGEKKVEKPQETKYHQLVVPNGKHTCLILADGSTLHVNAGTRVVYPDRFKENRREIFVDGEIYIDVVRNEKSPFVVNTTSCNIEVLGTSFNVNAYSVDPVARVALVNGSVKLKDKKESEMVLKPNELAVLKENSIKGKYQVNAEDYASWTKGLLKLNGTPLHLVFKRLERYYGVQMEYSDEVGQMKMHGNLDLDCPVEEVLRRISYTAPISYVQNEGEFEIEKKNV